MSTPIDRLPADTVNIRTSPYFQPFLRIPAFIAIILGLAISGFNIFAGGIIIGISYVIVSTHYRLAIYFDNKTYFNYIWVLGIKHGHTGVFEKIECIAIDRQANRFNAHLKLSDNQNIHLQRRRNKTSLIQNMTTLAAELNTKVVLTLPNKPLTHLFTTLPFHNHNPLNTITGINTHRTMFAAGSIVDTGP